MESLTIFGIDLNVLGFCDWRNVVAHKQFVGDGGSIQQLSLSECEEQRDGEIGNDDEKKYGPHPTTGTSLAIVGRPRCCLRFQFSAPKRVVCVTSRLGRMLEAMSCDWVCLERLTITLPA